MGDGVYLFGIASAHRDGIGALKIAIHFIVTVEAITAAK